MRQIVLDTETTGLEVANEHRIIEIGAVEIVNRRLTGRHFHQYVNPGREIDPGASDVHGITTDFLIDKPSFSKIIDDFLAFIGDDTLIIHNAAFDLGFLNNELKLLDKNFLPLEGKHEVIDTLTLARKKHPGQKTNLDALCRRYAVDNSSRSLHGALLDSEILADVYLLMTGGQVDMNIGQEAQSEYDQNNISEKTKKIDKDRKPIKVVFASSEELISHEKNLQDIEDSSGICVWKENSY